MSATNLVNIETLSRLRCLRSLQPSQLERLAASLSVKEVKRKELIFDQGELAATLHLLLSGTVRISLVNQEEKRVLLSLIPVGEFFGIASFFADKRNPYRCEAFSDCLVGTIRPETFVEILLGVSFEKYVKAVDVTMSRIWRMFLHCIRGIGLSLRRRLALELLELAASFGAENPRGTILAVASTHEDLANAIGASRQKVTECLKHFERRRIVIREGRRLIVNPHKLREIVEKG